MKIRDFHLGCRFQVAGCRLRKKLGVVLGSVE